MDPVSESGAVDPSEGALESDFQKRMDESWVRGPCPEFRVFQAEDHGRAEHIICRKRKCLHAPLVFYVPEIEFGSWPGHRPCRLKARG